MVMVMLMVMLMIMLIYHTMLILTGDTQRTQVRTGNMHCTQVGWDPSANDEEHAGMVEEAQQKLEGLIKEEQVMGLRLGLRVGFRLVQIGSG